MGKLFSIHQTMSASKMGEMSPGITTIVIVELRGYGYDENALAMGAPFEAASFENYGIVVMIENDAIVRAQLNMYDRNVSIVYLK